MARHLNREPWMWRNAAGTWQLKRVTSWREIQFPRHLRVVWRDHGAVVLVKTIMARDRCGLAAAWDTVKVMVNGTK